VIMKERKLNSITKAQNDIYYTVVFMSKLKNDYEDMKLRLKDTYKKQPEDMNALLAYAIFLIMPHKGEDIIGKIDAINEAIDLFDDMVTNDPYSWLGRYYKTRVPSLFADMYRDDEDILMQLNELIELQSESMYEPYFILPYLQCAELYLCIGEIEKALKYIEEAKNMNQKEIVYLPDLLHRQIIGLESKLRVSGQNHIADEVLEIGKILFPQQVG